MLTKHCHSNGKEGYQSLILSLALFEEHTDGDDTGLVDDDESQAGTGEDVNGGDRDGEGKEVQSSRRLLLWILVSSSLSFPSPLIRKSFNRFTSDNFTGFSRKSWAPSSKHLLISSRISSQWIATIKHPPTYHLIAGTKPMNH